MAQDFIASPCEKCVIMCFNPRRDKAVRRAMATACPRFATGDTLSWWGFLAAASGICCIAGERKHPLWDEAHASLAEEFDHVGRGRAGLAEGDPAVAAQGELFAPQHDLLVALDGDEGAVGAVVREDVFVEPTLDLAVRARSHALLDDEIGGRIAPKCNRGPLRRQHHLTALHDQPQLRVLRLVD